MKKIIYCFGMMTLIAALIGDAEAMSRVRGRAKGKGWAESTNPANVFVENAKGELVSIHPGTRLPVSRKHAQQELLTEQQELLRSYAKEVERVTALCGQVQAFTK